MIAGEVDDKKVKETAAANSSSSRKQVERSTGPVDRPQYQKFGRPGRSIDVHNVHKLELGRLPGRPTESTQLSVGHPVDRWKGSVDRPVDRQSGAGNILLIQKSVYLKAILVSRVLYLVDLEGWSSLAFKEAASNCNLPQSN